MGKSQSRHVEYGAAAAVSPQTAPGLRGVDNSHAQAVVREQALAEDPLFMLERAGHMFPDASWRDPTTPLSAAPSVPDLSSVGADHALPSGPSGAEDGRSSHIEVAGDGVNVAHQRQAANGEDGTDGLMAGVGEGGVMFGMDASRSQGGREVSTAGSLTVDPATLQPTLAGSHSIEQDGVRRGVSGEISAERAQVGRSRTATSDAPGGGKRSVSASGTGYVELKNGDVQQDGGRYSMDRTAAVGGRLGVDAAQTAGGSGKALVGGSVGFGLESSSTQAFASREEAEGASPLANPFLTGLPWSTGGALDLEAGERRGTAWSGTLGGSAGLSGGSGQIGAAGALTLGGGRSVQRLHGEWVRFSSEVHGGAGGQASLGAPGLYLSADAGAGVSTVTVWDLDLSTEAGQLAYDLLSMGAEPKAGPSVVSASATSVLSDQKGVTAALGPASVRNGTQRSDTHQRHNDNRRSINEEGVHTQQADWTSWLSWLPGLDTARGVSATSQYDPRGAEQRSDVFVVARTQASRAHHNHQAMGSVVDPRSSGLPDSGPATPGQWDVALDFGDDSLKELIRRIEDPDFSAEAKHLDASGRALVDALRKTGSDVAAQRDLLQDFGTGGVQACQQIRQLMGRGSGYVGLQGSDVWIGHRGWEGVEREVEGIELAAEDGPLSERERVDLFRLVDTQEMRLLGLTDMGSYRDVPDELRAEEVGRTKMLLRRLAALDPGSDSPGLATDGLSALRAEVAQAREQMDEAYRAVQALQRANPVQDRTSMELLQATGGFEWARGLRGVDRLSHHAEAERLMEQGEHERREGGSLEAAARKGLREGSEFDGQAGLEAARSRYRDANRSFAAAGVFLRHISRSARS